MVDNKKYYYLKLKDNFFESDELKMLQSYNSGKNEGYVYSDILLKMYLKSLIGDGALLYRGTIPYSERMIATVTNHSIGEVKDAIAILKELGLITVINNGTIFMNDIQNFVGTSSTEADRIRAYRNKIKSSPNRLSIESEQKNDGRTNVQDGRTNVTKKENCTNVQQTYKPNSDNGLYICTPEYRDKRLEYRDKNREGYIVENEFSTLLTLWQKKLGILNSMLITDLQADLNDWGYELLEYAIKRMAKMGKKINRPYNLLNGMLINYRANNVSTVEEAKEFDEKMDSALATETNDKPRQTKPKADYDEIINYLNQKTGKNFRTGTPKTKRLIDNRTNEGFTTDDFKQVIDNKSREWIHDAKMKTYLRPETLFGTKFEGYLNETPVKKKPNPKEEKWQASTVYYTDVMVYGRSREESKNKIMKMAREGKAVLDDGWDDESLW